MSGHLIATRVMEKLTGDDAITCLEGLKHSELGQAKLAAGDCAGAITLLSKAQRQFAQLPDASRLLGVTEQDLAAANGNLGRQKESMSHAQEAIRLLEGCEELRQTMAMAYMTLGIGNYQSGRSAEGARCFDVARQKLSGLPNSGPLLDMLNGNEAQLRRL